MSTDETNDKLTEDLELDPESAEDVKAGWAVGPGHGRAGAGRFKYNDQRGYVAGS